MPQKSRIETDLSEEDLSEFRRLLASGRLSIDALATWLGAKGYEISRSSVGRYAKSFDQVARKLRESRDVTNALVAELGEAAAQGKQGRLLVEMARTAVFDLLMRIQSTDAELDPKDVMMLGKGLAELGKALRLDQDFEVKIREQVAKETRERAAIELDAVAKAAAAAGEKGLSAERVAELRRVIAGGV